MITKYQCRYDWRIHPFLRGSENRIQLKGEAAPVIIWPMVDCPPHR